MRNVPIYLFITGLSLFFLSTQRAFAQGATDEIAQETRYLEIIDGADPPATWRGKWPHAFEKDSAEKRTRRFFYILQKEGILPSRLSPSINALPPYQPNTPVLGSDQSGFWEFYARPGHDNYPQRMHRFFLIPKAGADLEDASESSVSMDELSHCISRIEVFALPKNKPAIQDGWTFVLGNCPRQGGPDEAVRINGMPSPKRLDKALYYKNGTLQQSLKRMENGQWRPIEGPAFGLSAQDPSIEQGTDMTSAPLTKGTLTKGALTKGAPTRGTPTERPFTGGQYRQPVDAFPSPLMDPFAGAISLKRAWAMYEDHSCYANPEPCPEKVF